MKPKLLILDDSRLVLSVLEETVKERDLYVPYTASSYEEAKVLMKQYAFEAAILDLELPDSANAAHVDYVLSMNIAVVVLSGTYNENLRKMVSEKPIVDYIVKGSLDTIHVVVEMVENILLYKNKRVLVIDDSKVARMQLKNHLKILGFLVQEADSAETAYELMQRQAPFDLVTVDYNMPGKNGIEFIRSVRKHETRYMTLFFGVTGHENDELNIEFLKCGAYDTFGKPLQKELFNIKIANAFSLMYQHKELRASEHVFNEYIKALDNATIATKSDTKGVITYTSKAFCELAGYKKEELMGRPHSILRHPQTPKEIFLDMWDTITSGEIWKGLLQNRKKNGESFFISLSIVPLKNENGDIKEYISFRSDVTELIHSKKELQEQFYTDTLTSLRNRNRLLIDIEEYVNPALAIIHFNNFKDINNFYGENIGDGIIRKFAQRIFDMFSQEGYVAYRFGGVDFAVLKEVNTETDVNDESLYDMLKKLHNCDVEIQGQRINFNISSGISYESKNTTYADMAMKIARRQKKIAVVFDDSLKITQEYKNNIIWTERIRKALQTDNIICYYQPIINNKTRKVEKYESLVRLKDEDGQVFSPFSFLEIAQKSGLYREITFKVIERSFEKFKDLPVEFSVNLTVDDILDAEINSYIIANLKNIQKNEASAIIELVESAGIESYEEVRAFIREIKSYGAKLAIDDFGTGYSNFEYLVNLEPDYIKIDGTLIKEIDTNKSMYDIVKTITDFAHQKSYKVIAEFVSSQAIQENVEKLGIECSQGYFHAEPKPELIIES